MLIEDLPTPALLVDAAALRHNLATMSAARPGNRLRPHVKAHKTTGLARLQRAGGHHGFTCATIREAEVMAGAGMGEDLLLANQVVETSRLGVLVEQGHRVTVAVDSLETVDAAARGGVREVVVDVNVGMPRCGCAPDVAGRVADAARDVGLSVRGVMGYEGHLMLVRSEAERKDRTAEAMGLLSQAHRDVGGELVSAGGTGTFAVNTWASEIQAGSYALMDSAYGQLSLGFQQAIFVLGTVVSVSREWAVADVGLKALSLDHGLPSIPDSTVWFCSDEHVTYSRVDGRRPAVGERVRVVPSHVDPTVALHDTMYVVDGAEVLERWIVDMRGW